MSVSNLALCKGENPWGWEPHPVGICFLSSVVQTKHCFSQSIVFPLKPPQTSERAWYKLWHYTFNIPYVSAMVKFKTNAYLAVNTRWCILCQLMVSAVKEAGKSFIQWHGGTLSESDPQVRSWGEHAASIQRKILVVWGYSEYTGSHRSGLESWGLLKIPAVTSEWPGHSSSPGEKVRVPTAWGSMLRAGLRNQAHRAGMAQFPVYILLSSEECKKQSNKQNGLRILGF